MARKDRAAERKARKLRKERRLAAEELKREEEARAELWRMRWDMVFGGTMTELREQEQ